MTESAHRTLEPIFDSVRRVRQRARAMARLNTEPPVLWREAAEGIADRLIPTTRHFTRGLHLGGWQKGWTAEIAAFADSWQPGSFDSHEALQAEGEFDLIVSLLDLHSLNDLPGALAQIRQRLKPDGLFLAALFGGQTLQELRETLAEGEIATSGAAIRRIAPFAEVPDLGKLLQRAKFTMPIADSERTTVRYRALGTLMADLRSMGETGYLAAPTPKAFTRTIWAATQAFYAQRFSVDGRFAATFDIVYLTGWAPRAKALRPQPAGPFKPQSATKIRIAKKPTH